MIHLHFCEANLCDQSAKEIDVDGETSPGKRRQILECKSENVSTVFLFITSEWFQRSARSGFGGSTGMKLANHG